MLDLHILILTLGDKIRLDVFLSEKNYNFFFKTFLIIPHFLKLILIWLFQPFIFRNLLIRTAEHSIFNDHNTKRF